MDGYNSASKFRQKETIDKYRNDQAFKENWDNQVKDLLQTEFINKYKNDEPLDKIREDVW